MISPAPRKIRNELSYLHNPPGYENLKAEASEKVATVGRQITRIAWSRLFVFLASFTFFYSGIRNRLAWEDVTGGLFLIAFFALIKIHGNRSFRKKVAEEIVQLNEKEIRAQKGDLSGFDPGNEFIDRSHPFTYDLDVFGKMSLFQAMNRTVTLAGRDRLASWLQNPGKEKENILQRQETISELAEVPRWRQLFYAYGEERPEGKNDRSHFGEWLRMTPVFEKWRWAKIISFLLPASLFVLIILWGVGTLPYQIPLYFLLIPALLEGIFLKKINRYHRITSSVIDLMQKNKHLLNHIGAKDFTGKYLQQLKKQLNIEGMPAGAILDKLVKQFNMLDARHNIFVGVVLNLTMLWDFWVLISIRKWLARYGRKMSRWFDVVAEVDALNSLAAFSANNPEFVFPEITETGSLLCAGKLGHPMIPAGERVDNDFIITKKGEFHIITGPNMAGKSTFLRTVGINLILAHAGAPVCARGMSFRISDLYTGMRTSDSLEKHESYFYAELNRLRIILDRLKEKNHLPVIVLLDEILKGTNSRDKASGSQAVLRKMISLGGAGIIATHDLILAEMEKEFPDNIVTECFEAVPEKDTIRFDYILYPGITKHMNATFLMKLLGIID